MHHRKELSQFVEQRERFDGLEDQERLEAGMVLRHDAESSAAGGWATGRVQRCVGGSGEETVGGRQCTGLNRRKREIE